MGVANRPWLFVAALFRPDCILSQSKAVALEPLPMAALETVDRQLRQGEGMSDQETLGAHAQEALVVRLLRGTEATSYFGPPAAE
jgi:hypothetical protein